MAGRAEGGFELIADIQSAGLAAVCEVKLVDF